MDNEYLSNIYRPGTLLCWNDNLDEGELRRQIREMAEKGWGSFFMHSTVGLVTEYLSDRFMSMVKACADEAEKCGIYSWIYDEDTWPSGFAGGTVPRANESYRARLLILLPAGQKTANDTVLEEISFNGAAYDICKRVAPLGNPLFKGASHVDLMNPEVVKEFIHSTYEPYRRTCGDHFGKTIPGVFTDEPSYISAWGLGLENECHADEKSSGQSGAGASGALSEDMLVLPWSDLLPDFFKKMKGYDILDKVSYLFFDIGGYHKVRYDFYDAATELFKSSFTKQYYEWCAENGLKLTGHFLAEDSLYYQTSRSGDVMSHYEYIHWPAVDKLVRNVRGGTMGHDAGVVTIKQVSSAAEQLGKERVLSESFAGSGGQVSFFHRKWIFDWQAVLGINFITNTPSYYTMRGERKRNYPANLFYQQPWWEDEKGLADHQAGICAAISGGVRLVDILVIQPLGSVWCEYSPLHIESGFAPEKVYDVPFEKLSTRLLEQKLDFHYGNENLMSKYASVSNGELRIGKHGYKCVIIPPVLTLKTTTVSLIQRFLQEDGKLIIVGRTPALADGADAKMDFPGAFGTLSVEEAVSLAGKFVSARVDVTDILTGANAPSVYVQSRRFDDSVRHFITNTDEKRTVHAKITVHGCEKDRIALIDTYDGGIYTVDHDNGSYIAEICPAGSLLMVTGKEALCAVRPLPAVLGSGASFIGLEKILPSIMLDKFKCTALEENVLLLNEFILELNGKEVYRGPVCGAWNKYFYPAKDGTDFKAAYEFRSEIDIDGCFAVIEAAENLDSIIFNGQIVRPSKKRDDPAIFNKDWNWKDSSFIKMPLPRIKKGDNALVISGKKVNNIIPTAAWSCSHTVKDTNGYKPTEAEEIYICGGFSVKPVSEGSFVITGEGIPKGRDLTREGYPFYCGRAVYKTEFELDPKDGAKVYIKLNNVEAASAAVRVNNKECGVLRWKPYILDVTDVAADGENTLEIELSTTLVNAFGPNRRVGVKNEVFVHPGSFYDMGRFDDRYELFAFGFENAGIYII